MTVITDEEYRDAVLRTESNDLEKIGPRLIQNARLLHASLGAVTEAGELADALKKHVYYGKPLDRVNLVEEIGDLFWYMEVMLDELGVPSSEVRVRNVAKLRARYGDKFSSERAIHRDLETETKALKGNPDGI